MTADIDREKLRELCEQATPGPWRWWTSCSWRRLSSDARGKDRDGRSLDRDGGVICPHVCRDGHPDLIVSEEDADFIAAARTALPALLDLTDAQAAKIAELEERASDLQSILSDMEGVHERAQMTEIENAELKTDIASLESERDQLRKQVEGLRWEPISTAPETGEDLELLLQDGEISEARWNNERYCMLGSRAGSFPPGWSPTRSSGVDLNLPMTFDGNEPTHWRLAAASALEQKEQG